MSNSNTFNNNLQQTPINFAYEFKSFSSYINNNGLASRFSPICIFCSSKETTSLMNDGGSFRHCKRCNKQFKAQIVR